MRNDSRCLYIAAFDRPSRAPRAVGIVAVIAAYFDITYEDHQMSFSSFPMQVGCGEHVVFNAIVVTGCDHDDVRAAEIGEQK